MNLLNNKYDKIVCISLKECKDKYIFAKEQFNKHNIQVEFYRPVISGYASKFINLYTDKYNNYNLNNILFNKHFPNEYGAFQSHYHVIKTALLENVQNLFVFEDDCAFHKNWDKLLPKYLNTIPDDANGILLYSYMDRLLPQNKRINSRWTKGFASWSLLAYGMDRKTMETYIKIQDKNPMIADKASWMMMTHQNINFYIASPPLVIPSKNLISTIRGNNKNYEKNRSIFLLGINEDNYQ